MDQQTLPDTAPPLFVPAPGLRVVLASASPRRRKLLASWGLPFTVLTAPDKEEPRPAAGEDAAAYALRAARSKARRVHPILGPEEASASLVIAADTVVCLDGRILGKPRDRAEALAMLEELAGRTHSVTSAVALRVPESWPAPHEEYFTDTARVTFADWPRAVLAAYARTGEPDDKAGAYAVQGRGAFLAERLDGAWSTVVGLPLTPLAELLLGRGLIRPAA
ncbi:MAG: septum formation protein Maf [Desulfovibrio sp.]|uniref:Maf family protein n=1 Tax=Desulfovibrio sp. TaxID=885 RepID=UPI001A7A0864|nr:Maf family protein [Desulfovibrio sp.]MBD5418317.1 septum formation protein Maf [Desulfovibrio sp.]